ncbi:hypothetical protein [Paraburkholderia solisilvae]|uniref:Guanylate cyclase domain-containing protein n=1 Tax=Paraburkholderia solisilvae TaxID=624376 RepID=A0A6J5DZE3_9BURK|nr:hypothetical protein [Paraburkholderia solisilvae]CAB3759413.1 hypothetical protein LMG29739_03147 [Paraburkholderia solisilvae]
MESTTYTKRVAVFLDILGFKELINANREADIVKALTLTKEAESGPFHNAPHMRLTAFSDSVVVSDEIGNGFGYARILHFASYLSWQLLAMGILTRGGVGHGPLHHRENGIVFGPALIQAYELESKQAVYPRILVPNDIATAYIEMEVSQRGEQARAIVSSLFRTDFDGNVHLHILGPFAHAPSLSDAPGKSAGQRTRTSQDMVLSKSACLLKALDDNSPPANQPSATAKHYWFRNYLRETLHAYGVRQ